MTGRRMSLSFGLAEDAYRAARLHHRRTILRTSCGCSPPSSPIRAGTSHLLERYKAGALDSYDLSFASATARARARIPAPFTRGGDPRWAPAEKAEIGKADLGRFKAFFEPVAGAGPDRGDHRRRRRPRDRGRSDEGRRSRRCRSVPPAPVPESLAPGPAAGAEPASRRPSPIKAIRQPGLCADRLVHLRRHRPASSSGGRSASPPTCSRCGCSSGCARRKAQLIRRTRRFQHVGGAAGLGHLLRGRRDQAGERRHLLPDRPRDRRRSRRQAGRRRTSSRGRRIRSSAASSGG